MSIKKLALVSFLIGFSIGYFGTGLICHFRQRKLQKQRDKELEALKETQERNVAVMADLLRSK